MPPTGNQKTCFPEKHYESGAICQMAIPTSPAFSHICQPLFYNVSSSVKQGSTCDMSGAGFEPTPPEDGDQKTHYLGGTDFDFGRSAIMAARQVCICI